MHFAGSGRDATSSPSLALATTGLPYLPGLIPIDARVPGDTIDDRHLDRTGTFLAVVTDSWNLGQERQLSLSGFFQSYALTLRSNFGDGLIQQSESRNILGGETTYIQSVHPWLSLLAGVDLRRDVPRNVDLKKIEDQDIFQPVTSNNLTMSFVEPFVSLDGTVGKHLHYDLGTRQEVVWMDNRDLINSHNSFSKLATLTLPKGTLTFLPRDRSFLPMVVLAWRSISYRGSPDRQRHGAAKPPRAHARLSTVLSKLIKQTQLHVTLRRVSNSQELED